MYYCQVKSKNEKAKMAMSVNSNFYFLTFIFLHSSFPFGQFSDAKLFFRKIKTKFFSIFFVTHIF